MAQHELMNLHKLRQLELSLQDLKRIHEAFTSELHAEESSMKMLSSCVYNLPTGEETGVYYALDLGGTNLRALRKELPNGKIDMIKQKIPTYLMSENASGNELFLFIATVLLRLMVKHNEHKGAKTFPVGFTFSFPMRKTAINSTVLCEWTKGFSTPGVVNEDVCELLNIMLKHLEIPAEIVAVINDTTGTNLAGSLKHENCRVGIILGTGTNAAYYNGHEIINTEWGGFNKSLPLTKPDVIVDENSPNPGKQLFEKMISGMYLGEITRLWLMKILGPKLLPNFTERGSYESRFLTQNVISDSTANLSGVQNFLVQHGISNLTLEQRQIFKTVNEKILFRSADLLAMGLFSMWKDMKLPEDMYINVAIDGALYARPEYQIRFKETLKTLGVKNVGLHMVDDGSGLGAILAAAAALKVPQLSKL